MHHSFRPKDYDAGRFRNVTNSMSVRWIGREIGREDVSPSPSDHQSYRLPVTPATGKIRATHFDGRLHVKGLRRGIRINLHRPMSQDHLFECHARGTTLESEDRHFSRSCCNFFTVMPSLSCIRRRTVA
jgi:hypothetical protein